MLITTILIELQKVSMPLIFYATKRGKKLANSCDTTSWVSTIVRSAILLQGHIKYGRLGKT